MKWLKWFIIPVIGCFILAGCNEYTYTVDITPQADHIRIQLTCSDNMPAEKLKQIATLFPEHLGERVFAGNFTGKLPRFVPGAGNYAHFSSNMGSFAIYTDRLGGNDDMAGKLDKMRHGANQMAKLIAGWLQTNLGNDPNYKYLKQFCDTDLKRDIRNLSLLFMVETEVVSRYDKEKADKELPLRMLQYLAEHNYFPPAAQLPQIKAAIKADDNGSYTLSLIRDLIARKMHYTDALAISKKLQFLANGDNAKKSFNYYIANSHLGYELLAKNPVTDYLKNYLAKLNKQGQSTAKLADMSFQEYHQLITYKIQHDSNTNMAGDVLLALVEQSAGGNNIVGATHDKITITLHCPDKPLSTNGKYDSKKRIINFSDTVKREDNNEFPALVFAAWTRPDKDFQTKHFGKVLIKQYNLQEYCLWYNNLNSYYKRQWNGFILNQHSQQDIMANINAFKFKIQNTPTEKLQNIPFNLETGPKILKQALEQSLKQKKTKTVKKGQEPKKIVRTNTKIFIL